VPRQEDAEQNPGAFGAHLLNRLNLRELHLERVVLVSAHRLAAREERAVLDVQPQQFVRVVGLERP
jgi:hypothetical protein